ncbi:hypothetical protein [Pantoea sp. ACRSB]|uniref:hypothetical protein n=1 Tax=Pantoea sp. ACRSB TaxID=2918207 RepID=UPI002892D3AB|nr:hypothetical protein [Pantoea sp. ACRSB]MCG7388729.1 hypothetical protein [Pantoea sp. ACRSB]
MRERPILLNADMVRAVLNGSKTQTRRIITPQPKLTERSGFEWKGYLFGAGSDDRETNRNFSHVKCPFGQPGDRLWVRETFSVVPHTAYAASEGVQQVICPDDSHEAAIFRAGWEHSTGGIRWRPSIHMPRWASRITLEITGVRVERLASVSNDDARAEGYPAERAADGSNIDPWLWFRDLWDGIYPEQSFKVNPWVWVIEFKRMEGE